MLQSAFIADSQKRRPFVASTPSTRHRVNPSTSGFGQVTINLIQTLGNRRGFVIVILNGEIQPIADENVKRATYA
jgi:hypothetical protein